MKNWEYCQLQTDFCSDALLRLQTLKSEKVLAISHWGSNITSIEGHLSCRFGWRRNLPGMNSSIEVNMKAAQEAILLTRHYPIYEMLVRNSLIPYHSFYDKPKCVQLQGDFCFTERVIDTSLEPPIIVRGCLTNNETLYSGLYKVRKCNFIPKVDAAHNLTIRSEAWNRSIVRSSFAILRCAMRIRLLKLLQVRIFYGPMFHFYSRHAYSFQAYHYSNLNNNRGSLRYCRPSSILITCTNLGTFTPSKPVTGSPSTTTSGVTGVSKTLRGFIRIHIISGSFTPTKTVTGSPSTTTSGETGMWWTLKDFIRIIFFRNIHP